MKRILRVLLVGLVALVACGGRHVATAPEPDVRRDILSRDIAWFQDSIPLLRFAPFDAYAVIRLQVEQCTGLTRKGWPRFYVAPFAPLPGWMLAFYDEDTQAVVFALGYETRWPIVAHELAHWLLAPTLDVERREGESYETWTARVHPASIFGPQGTCSALLNPTS